MKDKSNAPFDICAGVAVQKRAGLLDLCFLQRQGDASAVDQHSVCGVLTGTFWSPLGQAMAQTRAGQRSGGASLHSHILHPFSSCQQKRFVKELSETQNHVHPPW